MSESQGLSEKFHVGRYPSLMLLTLVVVICNIDRGIIAILFEPIRKEFQLHDWQLGLLSGFGFTLLYSLGSLVIARQAERRDRITILSLAIAGWSLMTGVCGLAGSYVQLLLARMGVGMTEAGCHPPSHALIADMFDEGERPFALGVFAAGSVSGVLLSLPVGGLVAQHYGWRAALMIVGLPGMLLAFIVRILMKEPRAKPLAATRASGEQWTTAIATIFRDPVLRHAIFGSVLVTISSTAALSFGPAYLIRHFGLSEGAAGVRYGLLTGAAAVSGNLAYGFLTSRLVVRDRAWGMFIPAIASVLHIPALLVFLRATDVSWALAGAMVSTFINVGWMAATYATVQQASPPSRRATAAACLLTSYTLLGFGLGPLIAGVASDLLKPLMGNAAIAGGMIAALPFGAWASVHFVIAGRELLGRSRRANTLNQSPATAL